MLAQTFRRLGKKWCDVVVVSQKTVGASNLVLLRGAHLSPAAETAGYYANSFFSLMTIGNQDKLKPLSEQKKGVVESRSLRVNGADLHYEQTGTGDNHVLLLPGSLGSTRIDFGPQLKNFDKETFTLVALDPRGYGKSIPPERNWSLEFFERDALDAMKLMEMMSVKKFSVLGYEDGGTTALKLAANFPEAVDKLIVWGTSAYVTENDLTVTSDKWMDGMKIAILDSYGDDSFSKTWTSRMDTMRQYYTERKGNLCIDDLKRVQCETLIVYGDEDPIIHLDHSEFLVSNISNSKLEVIKGAGHNLHRSHLEEFNNVAEEFLTSGHS